MGKQFKMTMRDDKIYYIFHPYTKYEYIERVDYFNNTTLRVRDYVSYPLDIEQPYKYMSAVSPLPKKVALDWLEHVGVDRPTNKLMYVVYVGAIDAVAIYIHDYHYTLYRLKIYEAIETER